MRTIMDDDLPLQRIYRWEKERGGELFLTQPWRGKIRDWTWEQAVGEVRRMAAYLGAQGWEPGAKVAILSKNCAWWIMADLAIWMAGHVTVPIYPSLRAESVRQIMEHSEARACFLGPTDEREAAEFGIPSGVLTIRFPIAPGAERDWESVVAGNPPLPGNPVRGADDVATIIYTSGTTGLPKGAIHTFTTLNYGATHFAQILHLTRKDRMLSYLPLAHIVERIGLESLALRVGFRVFFTESLDTFITDLQRARATLFLSVPRLLLKFQLAVFAKTGEARLERLLRTPLLNRYVKRKVLRGLGLSMVKYAACGSAPLSPELLKWYRRLGLDLGEGYGMTEILITHLATPGRIRPGYVGPALTGVEVKLGQESELLVRSPMNMLGYYRDAEATRSAFTKDGFFRTGDRAEIAPDGQLKIVGRLKEQFKTSKGKYVVPAPIESKLISHPDVEACCLMGSGLPNPFAIVLLSGDARKRCADPARRKALEDSLQAQVNQLNAQLDPHERLSFIAIADGPWTIANGILTPTLKIKRSVLEARYQAFIDEWERRDRPVVWETAA